MNDKKSFLKNEIFISCLYAFLATIAINMQIYITVNAKGSKMLFWTLMFALFSYAIYNLRIKIKNDISDICVQENKKLFDMGSFIISMLLSLTLVAGRNLNVWKQLNNDTLSATLFNVLIRWIGFALIINLLLKELTFLILKNNFFDNGKSASPTGKLSVCFGCDRKAFFLMWLIIFLSWVPYFILFYPGMLTPDSCYQIEQSTGAAGLTSHHPVIHTLFIKMFILLGERIGTIYTGIALYTVAQMIIMSLMFSYVLFVLSKHGLNLKIRAIIFVFFAFVPFNALYSITMWKDIIFGGLMLVVATVLFEMIISPKEFFKSYKKIIGFTLLLFLFCVFRNNGLYAFILFIPFFVIILRKHLLKVLAVIIVCLTLYGVYSGPVSSALNVKKGSVRESLSIPIQQFARTVRDQKNQLSDEELDMIYALLPTDIPKLYNEIISDPIKISFKDDVFDANKSEYLKLWMKLFLRCPRTYILAFLHNSYGYWSTEQDYWIFKTNSFIDTRLGLEEIAPAYDVFSPDYISRNVHSFSYVPVLSMLYDIGFYVWLTFIAAFIIILKKRLRLLLPFILIGALWLTTLASPVYAEFRYIYGLILAMPICFSYALIAEKFPKKSE